MIQFKNKVFSLFLTSLSDHIVDKGSMLAEVRECSHIQPAKRVDDVQRTALTTFPTLTAELQPLTILHKVQSF